MRYLPSQTFTELLSYHLHLREGLVPQFYGFQYNVLGKDEDPEVTLDSVDELTETIIVAHLERLGRKYAASLPNACYRAQSGHACTQQHPRCQLRLFFCRIQPDVLSNDSLISDLEEIYERMRVELTPAHDTTKPNISIPAFASDVDAATVAAATQLSMPSHSMTVMEMSMTDFGSKSSRTPGASAC